MAIGLVFFKLGDPHPKCKTERVKESQRGKITRTNKIHVDYELSLTIFYLSHSTFSKLIAFLVSCPRHVVRFGKWKFLFPSSVIYLLTSCLRLIGSHSHHLSSVICHLSLCHHLICSRSHRLSFSFRRLWSSFHLICSRSYHLSSAICCLSSANISSSNLFSLTSPVSCPLSSVSISVLFPIRFPGGSQITHGGVVTSCVPYLSSVIRHHVFN